MSPEDRQYKKTERVGSDITAVWVALIFMDASQIKATLHQAFSKQTTKLTQ